MPYSIYKQNDKWLVINTETQKVKGTHDSKEKAEKQRRLLEMVKHGGTPTRG